MVEALTDKLGNADTITHLSTTHLSSLARHISIYHLSNLKTCGPLPRISIKTSLVQGRYTVWALLWDPACHGKRHSS